MRVSRACVHIVCVKVSLSWIMAKPKVKARNDTLFGVCIQIHHEIVHVKTLFEERCWERGEREIYRYTDATARAAVCEAVA